MKTQGSIFCGVILGLVATLLGGCAVKERPTTVTKTTTIDPDGTQTITTTTDRNSSIKIYGYKGDFSKFNVKDVWQEGGDSVYELSSDGAKLDPESQILKGFQSGFGAASQVLSRSGTGITPELQDRLTKLEEAMAGLDRIAAALEEANPSGPSE